MKTRKKMILFAFGFLLLGFLLPDRRGIPVEGATRKDWNANTFWYEPWGSSGVHKGIDIFADKGTPVIAPTDMLVFYRGTINKGGKVVAGLGPKWRIHYFAHLDSINGEAGMFVSQGKPIGSVGDSGNAKGKPAHLHFSIVSILPLPWLMDASYQGYKKAFYLDPIAFFREP